MDAVSRLLAELVAIPSVNPMGRPVSGPGYLEAGLTAYLERWFHDLGVPTERHEIAPGRANLLARFDSPRARRTVLFDVHQDTVPTDGMTIDPFRPTVESGRMYGRGSCDIKGGMAAMLTAFARLVRERPAGAASVVLACTVDEEFTHTGSSHLATTPHGADLAVVAEPTLLRVVTTHKGAVRWRITAHGVACHSSAPERGVNAIYKMAGVVHALAEHAAELASSEPDPVLGPPSLSVGRIEGGVSANIVPDRCEIDIDRRMVPGERPSDCLARVESALRRRLGGLDGVEIQPPWVVMPTLAPDPSTSAGWLDRVKAAVTGVTGKETEVGGVAFGTDAGPLSESGLACLVFGPGDIAQAHTEDEWVDLDQVRTASEAYFEIARAMGG